MRQKILLLAAKRAVARMVAQVNYMEKLGNSA